ncbi:hypothetical protein V6N12_038489 [Hibiscus sabdariffa]|uniref:Uncharacterized protein n=1 Tax=Hibiscus sabdariffa TaxID=183260 RepID=A0ABR2BHP3_9ROSI
MFRKYVDEIAFHFGYFPFASTWNLSGTEYLPVASSEVFGLELLQYSSCRSRTTAPSCDYACDMFVAALAIAVSNNDVVSPLPFGRSLWLVFSLYEGGSLAFLDFGGLRDV